MAKSVGPTIAAGAWTCARRGDRRASSVSVVGSATADEKLRYEVAGSGVATVALDDPAKSQLHAIAEEARVGD